VERHKQIRVESVPQPELAGPPPVEKLLGDVDAVAAFGSSRQAEEFLGWRWSMRLR
jgi:hypothetical protein